VGLGHRKIVHVGGGNEPGAAGRRKGYLDAMRAHGLEEFAHVVAGDYSEESGAKAGSRLLEEKIDFTAVAAANDRMAVGVINSLTLDGLRVPDDVSIVGTDDSALARMRHRNLTSVSQRVPAFAKHVVELAVNRIDGSLEPSADVVVDPELVVRTSTAPPHVPARLNRPRPARRSQRTSAASATPPEDTASIRKWAAHNGLAVSARGRISAEVMEAYKNQGAGDGVPEKPALPKIADPFKVSFD